MPARPAFRLALAVLVLVAPLATAGAAEGELAALRHKHHAERSELVERHVHRMVETLVEAGKYEEARQALKRNARRLKAEQALELVRWMTWKHAESLVVK